jgi:hypothetical protein
MNKLYKLFINIVKAIPVLNTIISSVPKSNNVQEVVNKKAFIERTLIGIKRGLTTPTLSKEMLEFQMNPLIRILRVIGGISCLSLLGHDHINLQGLMLYVALFFTLLFNIYQVYILIHRYKHIKYLLKSGGGVQPHSKKTTNYFATTVMMKQVYKLVMRFYNLSLQYTKLLRSSVGNVKFLVGFMVFIFFIGFVYLFYNVISIKVLNNIIIGFVISVLTFVSERYIFTKIDNSNLVVQFIKRGVINFFIISICICTFMALGVDILNLTVDCDGIDVESNSSSQNTQSSSQNTQRIAATVATAGLGVLPTVMSRNRVENDLALQKVDPDKIPSPSDSFISSLIEEGEIILPLQELLNIQIKLHILLFVVFSLFCFLLFNKLFHNNTLFKLTNKFKYKYTQILEGLSIKYFYIMFIILTLLIIFLFFLEFIISIELSEHIDDYIRVHNELYKSSLLVLSINLGGATPMERCRGVMSIVNNRESEFNRIEDKQKNSGI